MTTAVAKRDERFYVDDTNMKLQQWQQKGCHLLCPLTLQMIPALQKPVVNAVQIDADPAHKEVYPQKGGGFSLSAAGFKRLLDAMVVKWNYQLTGRVDDGSDPNRCHYRAVGVVMGLDGKLHDLYGEKEIRLDVIVEELTDNYREKAQKYSREDPQFRKAFPTDDDIDHWIREKVRQDALQIKKHLLGRAQSGAMARACKSRGIRETYTADELKKPFVFVVLVDDLDENRPDDRAVLRDRALGANQMLYHTPPKQASTDHSQPQRSTVQDIEIFDVEGSSADHPPYQAKSDPAPSPDESLRADFHAAEPNGQVEVLRAVIKRKGYTGKIEGDMAKWKVGDRQTFLDRLLKMPDVTGAPDKLPFE